MIALPALWTATKLFLSGIPRQVWFTLAALLIVGIGLRVVYNKGAASVQAEWDAENARHAVIVKRAAEAARAKEAADRTAFKLAADKLKQENDDAFAKRDRTIADLRAGRLRVRKELQCPRTVSGATADSSGSDEAGGAYLSRQNQEFFLRIGTEADIAANRLTACQAILAAERN